MSSFQRGPREKAQEEKRSDDTWWQDQKGRGTGKGFKVFILQKERSRRKEIAEKVGYGVGGRGGRSMLAGEE